MVNLLRGIGFALLLPVLAATGSLFAATFTVDSPADAGPGTLRQAILDANANPGEDAIVFAIDELTIASRLPAITDRVTIDGARELELQRVVIHGPRTINLSTVVFHFGNGAGESVLRNVIVERVPQAVFLDNGANGILVQRVLAYGFAAGQTDLGQYIDDLLITGNRNRVEDSEFPETFVRGGSENTLVRSDLEHVRVAGPRNVIGTPGNGNRMEFIVVAESSGNVVEGNTVVAAGASEFPGAICVNGFSGSSTPTRTRIVGNHLSRGRSGVWANARGVEIAGNVIVDSTSIPIDVHNDGRNANDPPPDLDFVRNHPVLTSALLTSSALHVEGTLDSTPSTAYRIEVFSNPPGDDAEAHTPLGTFEVRTDAEGHAPFAHSFDVPVVAGQVLTATSTNLTLLETSELSAPLAIVLETSPPSSLGFTPSSYVVRETDGTVMLFVTRIGGEGTVNVDYATEDGSATAPADYTAASGTLTFGPGTSTQSIVIAIQNDGVPEAGERFAVTLSTGDTALVTIASHLPGVAHVPALSSSALLALALGLAAAMLLRLR